MVLQNLFAMGRKAEGLHKGTNVKPNSNPRLCADTDTAYTRCLRLEPTGIVRTGHTRQGQPAPKQMVLVLQQVLMLLQSRARHREESGPSSVGSGLTTIAPGTVRIPNSMDQVRCKQQSK
jgi:hypothetical protein